MASTIPAKYCIHCCSPGAIYIFLNANWAETRRCLGAAALLLGLALFTLAASTAIAEFYELQLRRAALAFTAGEFFGAIFVLFELLTKGSSRGRS